MRARILHISILSLFLVISTGSGMYAQYVDLLWERLAHYPFHEDARDISGFDNHGIVKGAILTEDYLGGAGAAYYFDGQDDYILCGNNFESLDSAITVSCWIKTDVAGGNSHIVSKYDFVSDAGVILGTQDGFAKWAGRMGSGQFIRVTSATRINDNRWHNLTGIVEGGTWLLYVDGILENQVQTGAAQTTLSTAAPLSIGYYFKGDEGDYQFFKGSIDNVIIYGRALNACELDFLLGIYPDIPR